MAAMTYDRWCSYKVMVMGEPPIWFHDPGERKRRYQAYRSAHDDNCITVDPDEPAFASVCPVQRRPNMGDIVSTMQVARMGVKAPPLTRRIWSFIFVVFVNLMVLAGPGFAGSGDVLVNGETLAPQNHTVLEALVGPLEPGSYWVLENGDFGRSGEAEPIANLRLAIQQRVRLAQQRQQFQQEMRLRQELAAQAYLNAMRQRQAIQQGSSNYMYGGRFSSGQRYGNGSWSHYNGYGNFGVGGTRDGCIYTPNWSNC